MSQGCGLRCRDAILWYSLGSPAGVRLAYRMPPPKCNLDREMQHAVLIQPCADCRKVGNSIAFGWQRTGNPFQLQHNLETSILPWKQHDYPLNLSISLSGGKERNVYFPSTGEGKGTTSSPSLAPFDHVRTMENGDEGVVPV